MKAPVLLACVLMAPLALVGCLGGGAPEGDEPLQRGDRNAVPAAGSEDRGAWASLEEAVVRPGVAIHTPTRVCPSNFLFIRPDNTSVFLGTTAWCMRDVPVGGLVTVGGPDVLGFLVYSSFQTMAENGEKDVNALEYNDFAVIKIDESYRGLVNPSMLHYGGPLGMAAPEDAPVGSRVKTYVNGTLPDGETRPKEGVVSGAAGEWALLVYGAPPVLPGEMGRGALTADGKALGVVVNLGVAPHPGANGVARLDTLMAYAAQHARLYMELVSAEPLGGDLVASLPLEAPAAAPEAFSPHA